MSLIQKNRTHAYKSRRTKLRVTYSKFMSQLNGEAKYFRTFDEKDLSFMLPVKSMERDIGYGTTRPSENYYSPGNFPMAEMEEDNDSDEELVERSVFQVTNDLNEFLWDFIHN